MLYRFHHFNIQLKHSIHRIGACYGNVMFCAFILLVWVGGEADHWWQNLSYDETRVQQIFFIVNQ